MPNMKDPEISAIQHAIGDDPKIKTLLGILLAFVKMDREPEERAGQTGFTTDPTRLSEGFPLADARLVPNEIEKLRERFSRVTGVILAEDPKGRDQIIRSYSDPKLLRDLLTGALTQEYRFSDGFEGSQAVALLAANETLLTILGPIRDNAQQTGLLDKWAASYCPVCGAAAHLCLIEGEDGRLLLSCSRCCMRWKFRRMACPFCGEAGKEKTRYFTVENDPIHRVYVCETCKHYLKSVDSREKPIVFARLEDLMTIRLDIIAKREGYLRDTVDLVSVMATGA
jgi:FdhE protein